MDVFSEKKEGGGDNVKQVEPKKETGHLGGVWWKNSFNITI